jgi:hypothetical protein
MKFILSLGFVFGLTLQVGAQPQANMRPYYVQAMYDYFGGDPFFAIPVFLAGDRASGDTLTVPDFDLYARRSLCYPKLGAPKRAKSNLTKELTIDEKTIVGSGQAEIKQIAEVAIGGSYRNVKNYSIAFTDVQVDETPIHDLTTQVDLSKCPFLRTVISPCLTGKDKTIAKLVVYGTRQFSINLEKKVAGSGGAEATSLVNRFFGKAKVEVKADDASQSVITISDSAQTPIAWKPLCVSSKDIQVREKQIKMGLFDTLKKAWESRDPSVAKATLAKSDDLIISPDMILENIFSEDLVVFRPEEIKLHRDYISFVTLHFLVASLYYQKA